MPIFGVNANLCCYRLRLGPLAQSVEQRTFNPWVVGSIPTGPTFIFKKKHTGLINLALLEALHGSSARGNVYLWKP